MKRIALLLAPIALAVPAAHSAEPFEGTVTFKISSRGHAISTMSYTTKGSHVLISAGSMAGVIMDRDKKEITILMPQQRMYMVRPLAQSPAGTQSPGRAAQDVSLVQTGDTENILGYACTKYLVTSKGSTTEMWVTNELGSFAGFGAGMGGGRPGGGGQPQQWEQALFGKSLFPMRIVGAGSDGVESFHLEVASVNRQPVDDSVFSPPADWKKFDLGSMMGGLGAH